MSNIYIQSLDKSIRVRKLYTKIGHAIGSPCLVYGPGAIRPWNGQGHSHGHDDAHGHGEGVRRIELEDGTEVRTVPPHFRLRLPDGSSLKASDITVETIRRDGRQTFALVDRGRYLESIAEVPEPHEFVAAVDFSGMAGGQVGRLGVG